ncbi:ABC transporter B family member 11-like [Miscanthus floridulus]|uniref:ABC transporter B family member 11-like n=1 Tax=Miscanthus floridulus TaxID=154761 RepID=UPI003458AD26
MRIYSAPHYAVAGPLESTEPVQYLCTPQARAQRFQHARTSKLSFMDATASRAGDQNGRDGEEKKDAAQVKKVSLLGMFRYADRLDVLLMVVGTVAAVGNGVAEPLVTLLFGKVIDSFGDSTTQSILRSVSKVVLDFVYLGIGAAVVSFLQVSCWTMAGQRQSARIRSLYLNAVLRQDIAFFDTELTTGQAVSRMSSDTLVIQDALGEKAGKLVQLSSAFFGGFVIAFTRGWLLTLVMLTSLPLIAIAGAVSAQFLTKVSSKKLTSYGDAGDLVEQTIGAIRTVVSFNGENKAIAMYKKFIKKAYRTDILEGLINGFGMGSVFCILFSSYGLAFWYGGKLIIDKGYTGGKIITVLFAVLTGATSLGNATPSVSAIAEGQSAAYRLFETIERKPVIDSGDTSGVVLEDMKGDVELKDVHFRYPARPDQLILDGLSLQVASGTTMAIVGESGSGKSTVISLVERFYDPQAGEVLIDGINIKNLRLSWIREKIGLVSQEPLLFMTSIKDNIMYGKEDATLEEIKRAAELANAANFVDKLPNGYDTLVGQRGAQLSGGQKQRIAIARAILKDPKILLLDEATSALDMESERIVQEALNRIMVERTTLVVAHRLSTVRNVDCITVVRHGKIVEQGPHDALVKDPNGAYSQLIRLQETHADGRNKIADSGVSDSRSKSTSLSLRRSINKDSFGNSYRYSFKNPIGLSVELHEDQITGEQKTEELSDVVVLKKAPIGRLFKLNVPEVPILLLGSIAATVHGVIFPLFGILMSGVIKSFYEPPDKLRKDTSFWALISVVLGVASLISIPAEYFLFAVAGGKLIERIRTLSFQSIVHQEVAWFDNASNSSGALGTRLSVDALNVRRLAGDNLALIVQSIASLTTGFVIAFAADWRLALIITCVIPLVGAQGYAQVKFLKGFSEDAKEMYEDASQVATDAVGSIRTVASFCAEKRVVTTYNEKCEALRKQGIRSGIVGGLGYGFSFLILYFTYGLCFYVGAQFVRQGKTTFPDVFRVFFALVLAAVGVSQASALASDATKARDSAISIFSILDRKSKTDSSSDDGMTLENVTGNINFNNVSFKYPSRPDVQIFSDFTLQISSGKTVALVGESGSGKSTIIALLERFYDPDSGRITLDGVEIKSLKVSWLRDQMGLVGQEPLLFNDTIHANITYGKHGDVTEEEVMAAAKAANAHEFISSLPEGYDTVVGEKGIQLSGGQKQRVAIARAIIKDPKILLLDEATSALDAESERIVQDALDRVMVSRTTIVVAHRLSTIKGADMIAVLKEGKIVEKGRHEALMRINGGAYASLVELRSKSE